MRRLDADVRYFRKRAERSVKQKRGLGCSNLTDMSNLTVMLIIYADYNWHCVLEYITGENITGLIISTFYINHDG